MLHSADLGVGKELLGVVQDGVYHVHPVPVALVGQVDEADLQADDVLRRKIWPGLDDGADLLAEYIEQLDVAGDARTVLSSSEGRQSVYEGSDDVLDVNTGLKLSTGLKEAGQAGEVELVWEDLRQLRSVTESRCKLWQI